jgi:hypothetical protein
MGISLSSLSAKLGSNVAATDIFLVSNTDSSQDNKITRDEFSKAFTGFYAQDGQGITLFENNGIYGLTISGSNGFVGINDRTPFVSLDVVDNLAATNGSGQIRLSTLNSGRKIAFSLSDPNTYYEFSKKPNDTKLYLESSINGGSTFSNLFVVDQSGNFGITNSTGALSNKFLVSGESIQFQNSGNAILFDPYNTEIKTSANDETLLLNYNNIGDINIGYNGVYVDNSLTAPKVGVGHAVPGYLFHISGTASELSRFQSAGTRCVSSYKNSVDTSYVGSSNSLTYIGPVSTLSETNLVISNDGFIGLGTTGPLYKLDVRTSTTGPESYTPASFQSTATQGTTQIVIAANRDTSLDATANRNSLVTFSRFDGSANTPKWSIGNLYNDSSLGVSDNDCFVFIKNGYFGASPNSVARLTSVGNLDIDGSYTSSDSYCKGKFVQIYSTRVTGSHIYFNPLINSSASNPSGHNDFAAPFSITQYAGTVEKISIVTSDTSANSSEYRFEISAVNPLYNPITPNGFISGFFVSPPSNPASLPVSGIIGYSIFNPLFTNIVYNKLKTNFNGTTSFTSGQMLQYRICETDGTKSTWGDVDFTVISTIAYTVV